MKAKDFITDASSFGEFPDEKFDRSTFDHQLRDIVKISDVSSNLSLWKNKDFLVLKKDDSDLVGFVKRSKDVILNREFNHIDLLYVMPAYRKTSAIKWLIYAIKENAAHPVIADGAIFKDGLDLIFSMSKHGASQVKVLNKRSGEKTDLVRIMNDPDLCYIFESTELGFGKNYLTGDQTPGKPGWVWYAETLFERV